MKRLLGVILVLFGLFAVHYNANAQTPQMSISAVNFPDTAHVNQSYNFTFIITNVSPANTFSGSVDIYFSTTLTGDTNSFGTNQIGGLAPFDTFTVQVNNYNFNPNNQPQFSTGDNVVVVWPSIAGEPAGDSLYLDLYIPDPAGINDKKSSFANDLQLIRVSEDQLGISIANQQIAVDQVRIYNLAGQEVLVEKNPEILNMSGIPTGIYIIEVDVDDTRVFQKFYKN